MQRRNTLPASIGFALLLALGLFSARARLFESTTADSLATSTPMTVVDTSADAQLPGGEPPATATTASIDIPGNEYDVEKARDLTRAEPTPTKTVRARSTRTVQRDDDDDDDDEEDDD